MVSSDPDTFDAKDPFSMLKTMLYWDQNTRVDFFPPIVSLPERGEPQPTAFTATPALVSAPATGYP